MYFIKTQQFVILNMKNYIIKAFIKEVILVNTVLMLSIKIVSSTYRK